MGEMEPRRLYIISKARSGSNQLAAYFNQVPGCRCYGEIFKPNFPRNRKGWPSIARRFASTEEALALHRDDLCTFWDRLVASHAGQSRIVGAKIFYTDRRPTPIWDTRVHQPDSLIVHLWRDAVFDSYVSLLRAEASDKWLLRKGAKPSQPATDALHFDVDDYKTYRRQVRRWYERTEKRLSDHPKALSVEYAEIAQPEQLAHRIGAFLDEVVTLRQTYEKQTSRAPISYLANPGDAAPYVDDRLAVSPAD